MNRKHLYRGQAITGEWIFGSLIMFGERTFIYPENGSQDDYHFYGYEVIPETVGQLWIKSEKKLFGGDLFTAFCIPSCGGKIKERICKVIDSNTGFDVSIWHNGNWWAYSSMNFTTMKIIGNIHDNPELLK